MLKLFKRKQSQMQVNEELNEFLDYTLEKRKRELELIEEQIKLNEKKLHDSKLDEFVNMPMMVTEVLDIYERSGIKIPIDIIEEVNYMKLDNKKDIFDFIENQRHYWVLENRKKPYRGVK